MAVREGYKQTEVGVIPEDWETNILYSVARVVDSLHHTPTFVSEGYSMVRVADIKTGNLDLDETLKVKESIFREFTKNHFPARGNIVLSRVGSYGVTSFVDTNEPFCMGQNTVVIESKCPERYLYYLLNSESVQRQIEDGSYGSGYKSLSLRNIKELVLPLPPTKAEQEAIAEALSDADALIESLKQLIAKKRQIKQGAMQELLTGKRRLPGFSGEWEIKTFGEVFTYLPTATNSRRDLIEDGDTYYIHYGDIHTKFHNHLDFTATKPAMIDRTLCRNAALIKNGDWVMADASEDYDGVGKTIEISGLEEGQEAVSGLHTFLLREKSPTFVPGFKGHLGGLKSLHEEYLRVATGMKVFGVSKAALIDLELPIPPPDEQTTIAKFLSDMDTEITALKTKLTKTRQIKQGMMQQLLTGKIRLIQAEATHA